MKSAISRYLVLLFLCLQSTTVSAAEISIDSNTIFQIEQRDVTGGDKQNIETATQFIGFDAGKLADGNLSLHFYGWGRADFGDDSYNTDTTDSGFTYGYLRYRFNAANADVRAGRFFVREGIVNEQVDGINILRGNACKLQWLSRYNISRAIPCCQRGSAQLPCLSS